MQAGLRVRARVRSSHRHKKSSEAGMEIKRAGWIAASLMVLVGVIIIYYFASSEESSVARNEHQVSAAKTGGISVRSGSLSQTRVLTKTYFEPTSIPASGMPLVSIMPALVAASNEGNYRASCRLAYDLNVCQLRALERSSVGKAIDQDQLAKNKSTPLSTKEVDPVRAERQRKREDAARTLCEGVDLSQAKSSWEYQLRAASQGHLPSMAQFAIGPMLIDTPRLDREQQEGWQNYEANAAIFLRQAADLGNLSALTWLISEASGNSVGTLRGISIAEKDDFDAAKYALVYQIGTKGKGSQNYEQALLPELRKKLGQERFSQAQLDAERLLVALPADFAEKQMASSVRRKQNQDAVSMADVCQTD